MFVAMAGYWLGIMFLAAWVYRGFKDGWPALVGLCLILGTTAVGAFLLPRALRVHRVLEKYQDPVLFESELFRVQDKDVAEALVDDSFGRTAMAVTKLRTALSINPQNVQARHLLSMIQERDELQDA